MACDPKGRAPTAPSCRCRPVGLRRCRTRCAASRQSPSQPEVHRQGRHAPALPPLPSFCSSIYLLLTFEVVSPWNCSRQSWPYFVWTGLLATKTYPICITFGMRSKGPSSHSSKLPLPPRRLASVPYAVRRLSPESVATGGSPSRPPRPCPSSSPFLLFFYISPPHLRSCVSLELQQAMEKLSNRRSPSDSPEPPAYRHHLMATKSAYNPA